MRFEARIFGKWVECSPEFYAVWTGGKRTLLGGGEWT